MQISKGLRVQIETKLGKSIAGRTHVNKAGSLYVKAGWNAFWAWLIDFLLVAAISLGLGGWYYQTHRFESDAAVGMWVITVFCMLTLPFAYGWFYGDGRALGGLVTKTQLVRTKTGGRLGLGRAGWAMFGRLIYKWIDVIGSLAGSASLEPLHTAIDLVETKQLHGSGFLKQ